MRCRTRVALAACAACLVPTPVPARPAPVVIAVVDTGVAPIPQLRPALVPGRDLIDGAAAAGDSTGHGTAMAVIAAGRLDRHDGVAGVCRTCLVMPVVAVGSAGMGTTALAAAGVRWAVDHGARVINLSLTSDADDPQLDAALVAATARGAVVVAAAGNGGASDPASGGYPAASNPEVVSVAGLDGRALAPWTNRGSWVTVAAPGRRPALSVRGVPFTALGSSAAAAYVSGVVGVMLAANPALTPAQVVSILLTAGSPVPGLDVRSGRVLSAAAAVEAARRTTAHGSSSASTGGTSL